MTKETIYDSEGYMSRIIEVQRNLVHRIKKYDMDLYAHSNNVAFISFDIGMKMGFSLSKLDDLIVSAFLHDIGKTCISPNLWKKESPLTEDEIYQMKQHPYLGTELCEKKGIKTAILAAIFFHHERENGSGYPKGISSKSIPQMAKIIAVADSYSAMIENRFYNEPISKEKAKEEIIKNSGILYDVSVVQAFKKCEVNHI